MEVNKEIKSQNIRATAPLFSPLGGGMSEDTFEVFIMSAEVKDMLLFIFVVGFVNLSVR